MAMRPMRELIDQATRDRNTTPAAPDAEHEPSIYALQLATHQAVLRAARKIHVQGDDVFDYRAELMSIIAVAINGPRR